MGAKTFLVAVTTRAKARVQGRFKVSTKEMTVWLGRLSRTFFVDQSVRNTYYSVLTFLCAWPGPTALQVTGGGGRVLRKRGL